MLHTMMLKNCSFSWMHKQKFGKPRGGHTYLSSRLSYIVASVAVDRMVLLQGFLIVPKGVLHDQVSRSSILVINLKVFLPN